MNKRAGGHKDHGDNKKALLAIKKTAQKVKLLSSPEKDLPATKDLPRQTT